MTRSQRSKLIRRSVRPVNANAKRATGRTRPWAKRVTTHPSSSSAAAFAGGLAQSARGGLRGQAQVAGRRRNDPFAEIEADQAQRPARECKRQEGDGKNEALGEKGDDASILVVGSPAATGGTPVMVRGRCGARPQAVQSLVKLRARGKNRED